MSICQLGQGQHFGEISMLFQCKRSVSVYATHYITCASIDRPKFNELQTLYPTLNELLKQEVIKYKDPLKCFLEMRLNQVDFFKNLPKIVKNDFIFNMRQTTFDKGSYLYRIGDESAELYLIQSGQLQIQTTMEKGQTFVIEKLFRGSIINHNSVLMSDAMDTDAYCKTNVHCFVISLEQINFLRQKYTEFDYALDKAERHLVSGDRREPAIDYIIQDTVMQRHYKQDVKSLDLIHNYKEEQRRRRLTLFLKNAILQVWLEVKEQRSIPNMEDIIRGLSEKSKQQKDPNYIENLKRERKERRERERREYQERMNAHLSQYINRDQFEYFDESLKDINKKISEHSEQVDEIELKLLAIDKVRRLRRQTRATRQAEATLKPGANKIPVRPTAVPAAGTMAQKRLFARESEAEKREQELEEKPFKATETKIMQALGLNPDN
jgi:CRP-like cAMP-binding protein